MGLEEKCKQKLFWGKHISSSEKLLFSVDETAVSEFLH